MSELERRRDALRLELEQVRAQTARHLAGAGGGEAQRLEHELAPLEAEIARLAELADGLGDEMVQLEDELEDLRREAEGARRHLADLEGEKS